MKPFDPDRMQYDPEYRQVVWSYWIQRDLDNQKAAGAIEIGQIFSLFEKHGIPRELAGEFVRRAYEDLTETQRFKGFADEAIRRQREQEQAILQEPETTDGDRAKKLKMREDLAGASQAHWTRLEAAYREISEKTLRRDTGIDDPAFYAELYAIPITMPATVLSTNMASNERFFSP